MEHLTKIADRFDWPARAVGKFGSWFILPLIAVIMFDVITRKIDFIRIGLAEMNLSWFNPIIFQDSEWHLHAILLFTSFGFGYLMNSHVRVDIFREHLTRRNQAWVEFLGLSVLAIPYLLLITYFAYIFVALSFRQGEGSESLTGIPARYIIKSIMVVGLALLLSSFVATLLRLIAFLFGNEAARSKAEIHLTMFAHKDTAAPPAEVASDSGGSPNA